MNESVRHSRACTFLGVPVAQAAEMHRHPRHLAAYRPITGFRDLRRRAALVAAQWRRTVHGRDRRRLRGITRHRGWPSFGFLPCGRNTWKRLCTALRQKHAIRAVRRIHICNPANVPADTFSPSARQRVVLNVDVERAREMGPKPARSLPSLRWLAARPPGFTRHRRPARFEDDHRSAYAGRETNYFQADLGTTEDDGTLGCLELASRRYVLYVSRLEPENNAHVVINAYARRGLTSGLRRGRCQRVTEYIAALRMRTTDPRV